MGAITTTFATTTTLSVLLHGAVLVGLLSVAEPFSVTGQGLQVQLISASNQLHQVAPQTQRRVENQAVLPIFSEHKVENIQHKNLDKQALRRSKLAKRLPVENVKYSSGVIVANKSSILIAPTGNSVPTVDTGIASDFESIQQEASQKIVTPAQPALSPNTLQQQHSILELLHASISDNKEYPYIARRQRREGVAKIGFVLNPDGSIYNARLVTSSHANVLDRAALSAVRAIEPFKPAQHYLKQAEAFEIDVVFQLL